VAAACRTALAPAALAYGVAMRLRARAYDAGWRPTRALPLPAVGIGSLQVGGAGKTPVASWAAAWYLALGVRPAVLLRGYGGDEGPLHRELAPGAVVVEDGDRVRGARVAARDGAAVAVLDDNAQHLRVVPDRQLLLIGVEALMATRALLPAGPWREHWRRGRADVLVVTRKTASAADAARARAELGRVYPAIPMAQARLAIRGWQPLRGGSPVPDAALRAKALLAVCGVADPRPFAAHAARVGRLRAIHAFRDHARYRSGRVLRLARAAESAGVDYVVTTAKDAVKLRGLWPAAAPPVLVADLAVCWEAGEDLVTSALEACLPGSPAPFTHVAAGTA
jgi:tetraacyldisaccharide 4'-kinase